MFGHTGLLERQVGYSAAERDIYVVNSRVDSEDWVSLASFVENNGGLIRIPFLNFTGAVVNIIKHVGE